MPCAVIVTCLFYGAISGSAPATVAAVGSMTIPILVRLGYDKSFSTAIVAVAGGLGVIDVYKRQQFPVHRQRENQKRHHIFHFSDPQSDFL